MSSFTWTSPDGVKITLPPLNSLKSGVIRKYRKLDELDFMYSILESITDESELAKIDDLGLVDTEALFADWQKDSKVTVPQS